MASTWSALQVELLETGANSGTWGTATNVNLGDAILGEAITGSATVDFPADADVTITLTNAATSQAARNLRLNITESGAGVGCVRNLILGSNCQIEKFYLIRNNGTGAKTIKNTSGTGVSVPAGKATLVYNDGTNVVDVLNSFSSAILGAENAGSIIPFYFANQAAFPSASTYHGAIAHSHADAAMYFAHGGSWVRMLDAGTDVTVAQGGTGLSTLTANNVIIGNGTSSPTFVAPSSSGNVLTSNGTTWTSAAPAAGGITYTTVKTANYTAVANDGVQTNTTSGAFTVTLPATPSNGDQVFVVDSFNTWGTNNLTIGRNGSTIEGVAADLVCDITGVSVQCIYNGTTWDIFAQVGGAGGSVVTGPASSTDNAIARFDGATGKIIQNSVVTIADSTGNVAGVGTLSLGTTLGVGGATPSASGSGITFPASQSASSDANTLDDYEEGIWTPAVTGGTLTNNNATYTKIGNRVLLTMDVSITSVSAGNITITGVPFTSSGNSISGVGGDQIDFTTALIGLHGYLDGTSIFFFYFTTATNGIRLTDSNIRAGTTLRCSFQYKT